jgi:uracil-DNA glycosylase
MSRNNLNEDSINELARDLLWRIRWEVELGAAGFPPENEQQPASPHSDSTPLAPTKADYQDEPAFPTAPPEANPSNALEGLRTEIGDCSRCGLHQGRTRLVFGEGNPLTPLVFVGEGPGRDEDLAGRPFVGAAGQLLDKIINAMGYRRDQIYICNVVKCRPPGNRTPGPEECATCGQFVRRQLEIINPKVVVALGATAAKYLLGVEAPLGALRGRFHDLGPIKVMPTYHPAYLLRNPAGKRPVWEDMQKVMKLLEQFPALRRQ